MSMELDEHEKGQSNINEQKDMDINTNHTILSKLTNSWY